MINNDRSLAEKIKEELRLKSSTFDKNVEETIDACKIDMKLAGINKIDEDDALIRQAITFYAKGNFGYDNSEKFAEAYEKLRNCMALSSDYTGEGVQDE